MVNAIAAPTRAEHRELEPFLARPTDAASIFASWAIRHAQPIARCGLRVAFRVAFTEQR